MCLIVARPAGCIEIPEEYIVNAWTNNSDGFGLVAKHGTDVAVVKKHDADASYCIDVIREMEKEDADILAHFRLATHGAVDNENTHPYQLVGDNYLVHNGIFNIDIKDKRYSDTWHLATMMVRDGVAMKPANILRYLSKREKIVNSGKVAVLGADLPLTIYNKDAGMEEDGVWYSNNYGMCQRVSSYSYGNWRDYAGTWDDDYEYSSRWGNSRTSLTKTNSKTYYPPVYAQLGDAARDCLNDLEAGGGNLQEMSKLPAYELSLLLEEYCEEIADLITAIQWITPDTKEDN